MKEATIIFKEDAENCKKCFHAYEVKLNKKGQKKIFLTEFVTCLKCEISGKNCKSFLSMPEPEDYAK